MDGCLRFAGKQGSALLHMQLYRFYALLDVQSASYKIYYLISCKHAHSELDSFVTENGRAVTATTSGLLNVYVI